MSRRLLKTDLLTEYLRTTGRYTENQIGNLGSGDLCSRCGLDPMLDWYVIDLIKGYSTSNFELRFVLMMETNVLGSLNTIMAFHTGDNYDNIWQFKLTSSDYYHHFKEMEVDAPF